MGDDTDPDKEVENEEGSKQVEEKAIDFFSNSSLYETFDSEPE